MGRRGTLRSWAMARVDPGTRNSKRAELDKNMFSLISVLSELEWENRELTRRLDAG